MKRWIWIILKVLILLCVIITIFSGWYNITRLLIRRHRIPSEWATFTRVAHGYKKVRQRISWFKFFKKQTIAAPSKNKKINDWAVFFFFNRKFCSGYHSITYQGTLSLHIKSLTNSIVLLFVMPPLVVGHIKVTITTQLHEAEWATELLSCPTS